MEKPSTTVVNIRHAKCDRYIGRGSPFGNPFRIGGEIDRDEAVRLFEADFHEKIRLQPGFLEEVLALDGLVLGCHCKPLKCHGDVIAKFLNERRKPA